MPRRRYLCMYGQFETKGEAMTILWIIIVVVVVLALLGFVGRGRL